MTSARFLLSTATTAAVLATITVGAVAPIASAADSPPTHYQQTAPTWTEAAAMLGTAGSLWQPMRRGGLVRKGAIDVAADSITVANGAATGGDTFAGAVYGRHRRTFTISESWAGTGWAAEPAFSTSMAKVADVNVRIGPPGQQITVKATVSANCFPQPQDAPAKEVPSDFRCKRSDVRRTGGILTMTAEPPSTMTAPGTTNIVIQSTGLTYRTLVRIASHLRQVGPTLGSTAGSAQMEGMCLQMVNGGMTFDQANKFAESNGYVARVGSVDGAPQAVTLDYRPNRFTLATTGGKVSGCSYG